MPEFKITLCRRQQLPSMICLRGPLSTTCSRLMCSTAASWRRQSLTRRTTMSGSVSYVQRIGLLGRISSSTGWQFFLCSWGKSLPLAGHIFLHPLRAGSDPECFMAFFDSFLFRLNSCWTSWETFSTNWEQRR